MRIAIEAVTVAVLALLPFAVGWHLGREHERTRPFESHGRQRLGIVEGHGMPRTRR